MLALEVGHRAISLGATASQLLQITDQGASISPVQTLTLRRWHLPPMKPQKRSNGTSQPKYWILAWRMAPGLRFRHCPFRSRSRSNPLSQYHLSVSTPIFRPPYRPRARIAHRLDRLASPFVHSPHLPQELKCGGTAQRKQMRHIVNPPIDGWHWHIGNFQPITYKRTYTTIGGLRLIPKKACVAMRMVAGLCNITTGA